MKLVNILWYLLVRSTGKPEEIEKLDGLRLESFYFNFGFFSFRTQATFEDKE